MTIHFLSGRMTAADFRACRELLDASAPGTAFATLLRRKLREAAPVRDEDIDPLVVTINSRIEYRIDDEPPQKRVLVRCDFRNGLVGLTLPVTTLPGLALLGLREGQSFAFEEDGRDRMISVLRVHYQPQAARRGRGPNAHAPSPQAEVVDLSLVRRAHDAAARELRPADRRRKT